MELKLFFPALLLLAMPPVPGAHKDGCSKEGENCVETGCCTNPGFSCFLKDKDYGACMEYCTPGIHKEWDGEAATDPWHCALFEDIHCPKENEECTDTGCCFDPGRKCFAKNSNFSICADSCEPGIHEEDSAEWRTPWDCTVTERTVAETTTVEHATSAPIVLETTTTVERAVVERAVVEREAALERKEGGSAKGKCASVSQQCGGEGWVGPSCCISGSSCNRTSDFYHVCTPIDVDAADIDRSGNASKGVHTAAPSSHRELSDDPDVKVVDGSDGHRGLDRVVDDSHGDQGLDLPNRLPDDASVDRAAEQHFGLPALVPIVACGALAASAIFVFGRRGARGRTLLEEIQGDPEHPLEADEFAE